MPDLILKLHPSESFSDKGTRQSFVDLVARLLSNEDSQFEPFQLNKNVTDLEWGVSANNDWFVFFDSKDWSRVRIKHRYDIVPALTSLGGWIAYRWRMKVDSPEFTLPSQEAQAQHAS